MGKTRYKSEYAAELIEYFNGYSIGSDGAGDDTVAARGGKSGRVGGGASLPSFAEFARRKGVLISDLDRWREEHAEFARAYAEALEYQRQLILQGVIDGRIAPAAAKFYLDERSARSDAVESAGEFKITVSFEGENGENV